MWGQVWKKFEWCSNKMSNTTDKDDHTYVYPQGFLTGALDTANLCTLLGVSPRMVFVNNTQCKGASVP